MKYYIEYPVLFLCNLGCFYCFHKPYVRKKVTYSNNFTIQDYIKFRDTHLSDAEEIIIHFSGCEPFFKENVTIIKEVFENTAFEKFDILSNGTQDTNIYKILEPYVNRIDRMGLTFHRKIIGKNKELCDLYEKNVNALKNMGLNLYIKEIYFPDEEQAIKEHKIRREKEGLAFKVQPFYEQPWASNYVIYDKEIIDLEYEKPDILCSCKKGYKTLLIRGGDWNNGDILACWRDQKVIGNVQENLLNNNAYVFKTPAGIEVKGVLTFYRGDDSVKNQIDLLEIEKPWR